MAETAEQLMLMLSTSTSTETENVSEVPEINPDDFKLGKVIGRGAFGTVHQGIWRERAVAIKRFDNFDEEKSFDIEVKQLSRVKNSNIISLFATAVDEDYKYIIMEYADEGTLDKFLHCDFKPIYTKLQAQRWALNCAEGVAYLHTRKPKPLLHRDLKPANLLLTRNNETLKICDFGTVTELKTKMTGEIGTAAYMAPEVFTGTKYNEKCDVYSFGILFWEILSRQKPFKEFEMACAIPFNAQKGLRPTLENCPPRAADLIKSCWHQDPEKRPTMKDLVSTRMKVIFRDAFFDELETIRNRFPSIPCVNWDQMELFEMIDIDIDNIVFTGKFSNKKVTILHVSKCVTGKFLLTIQQHLQLKHKNTVSILGTAENPRAAILDCADLIPLDKFLHGYVKLEYSRAHALSWAHQCAEGMVYLHTIKPKPFLPFAVYPRNLYLTLGGLQLKIGDLGFFIEENWCIAYDAPEVCEGFTPNEKSDVYSWGILLWEILTRKKPFDSNDIQQIISQIMDGVRPVIEDDWLEPIKELMQKCWKREPKERPNMERVARQMAIFDKDSLTPIVSAIDVQGIQNSKPVIDKKDLDRKTRYKKNHSDHSVDYKYILSMWKDQKIILASINMRSFRTCLQNYFPFHIEHQNIVSILAITKGLDFLILEFAEDGPLDEFLQYEGKTEYTIDHALSWAQQLAEGLAYLLNRQLRLRTCIPSDLFLSNKCRTLKIDPLYFDLFKFQNNELIKPYKAPKCWDGESETVYNWTIILWEILTRQKPFAGYSVEEIEMKTKAGDRPPIKEDWPDSIKVLMEKCWDSNPENRPKMEEVVSEMKKILVDFPGSDQPIEQEHKWDSDFELYSYPECYDFDDETDDETEAENDGDPEDEIHDETDDETDDETEKENEEERFPLNLSKYENMSR